MLGPSLLGRFAPGLQAALIHPDAAPFLGVLSQLGVILYMFLVGLELDLGAMRARAAATIAISNAGIIVPFALGVGLAWTIFESTLHPVCHSPSFALFVGVSMSITAFPVLARILGDRGLQRTPLGIMALTCAAIDDVTAWCLLAFVVSVMQTKAGGACADRGIDSRLHRADVDRRPARHDGAGAAARAIKPHRGAKPDASAGGACCCRRWPPSSSASTPFSARSCLARSSRTTARVARHVRDRIEDVVRVMLLPAFFAFTGLRTEIGLLERRE